MWFERPPGRPDWSEAERHLRRADPALRAVIDRVGPCTLAPRRDYFVVLCQAIFTQQISTAIATTLFGRFRDLFPRRRPTAGRVIKVLEECGAAQGNGEAPDPVLRACGLSRQKASYLLGLARDFRDGQIPTRGFARMSDEAVIDALVRVRGIGRWTAEMFLIFTLNRPDELPVDDLGLRENVRRLDALSERPTAAEVIARAEAWRPYRSIATWYLWRGAGAAANPPAAKKSRRPRAARARP
jgi:DNA-3-methyladenine glycosylase II